MLTAVKGDRQKRVLSEYALVASKIHSLPTCNIWSCCKDCMQRAFNSEISSIMFQRRQHPFYPVLHDGLPTAGAFPEHLCSFSALRLRSRNLCTMLCRSFDCGLPLSALGFLRQSHRAFAL